MTDTWSTSVWGAYQGVRDKVGELLETVLD